MSFSDGKMKTERMRTGMKANESLEFNLEKARELAERVGYELALSKLESMRLYRWVGCEDSVFCHCVICSIIDQVDFERMENEDSHELGQTTGIKMLDPGTCLY